MNRKTIKRINRHADFLLLEWLKTLISDKDYEKVSLKNMYSFLPDVNYFHANGCLRLSFYSPKWTRKSIKKLVSLGSSVEDITMKDLEDLAKKKGSVED